MGDKKGSFDFIQYSTSLETVLAEIREELYANRYQLTVADAERLIMKIDAAVK